MENGWRAVVEKGESSEQLPPPPPPLHCTARCSHSRKRVTADYIWRWRGGVGCSLPRSLARSRRCLAGFGSDALLRHDTLTLTLTLTLTRPCRSCCWLICCPLPKSTHTHPATEKTREKRRKIPPKSCAVSLFCCWASFEMRSMLFAIITIPCDFNPPSSLSASRSAAVYRATVHWHTRCSAPFLPGVVHISHRPHTLSLPLLLLAVQCI